MKQALQKLNCRLVAMMTLGLILTGLGVGTSSQAIICPPVVGGGSTECGFGQACEGVEELKLDADTGVREGGACAALSELNCPGGTYWIVKAGFASAGPLDYVLGTMTCNDETVAACTADLLRNPCQAKGDSIEGTGYCSLTVFDADDLFPVRGAYASCQDPIDPTRVIPAVITYQGTPGS